MGGKHAEAHLLWCVQTMQKEVMELIGSRNFLVKKYADLFPPFIRQDITRFKYR